VITLLWSPAHPIALAVPSAPVNASVLTLKLQSYWERGPGAEALVLWVCAGAASAGVLVVIAARGRIAQHVTAAVRRVGRRLLRLNALGVAVPPGQPS
jgi:hypothetical protein